VVRVALTKNPHCSLTVDELLRELTAVNVYCSNPWTVVNGHDLCRIAPLCQLRIFGREFTASHQVFEALAEHYRGDDFQGCGTYQELADWQGKNAGYSVIKGQGSGNDSALRICLSVWGFERWQTGMALARKSTGDLSDRWGRGRLSPLIVEVGLYLHPKGTCWCVGA
jgi:hypothetical protein